jgi:hypothetical protein
MGSNVNSIENGFILLTKMLFLLHIFFLFFKVSNIYLRIYCHLQKNSLLKFISIIFGITASHHRYHYLRIAYIYFNNVEIQINVKRSV